MKRTRVYLSVPHMGGAEQAFVREAFEGNWLSTVGPNLTAFEEEMAAILGSGRRTLAVSSGTAALHLILRALGVGRGDRVAVATLTFAGSVFPILYLGAEPVLIDSETVSGNIDPALVADYLARASRTGRLPKALIAVNLYGQHADLRPILAECQRYGVTLIEDAAESLGATYRGAPTATTAPFALLSFNGNKVITTTGGGMVVAQDPAALNLMRKWANQAREPSPEYLHKELGYNYRMSNVLAGIGRGQLRVLDQRVAQRQAVARRYMEGLGGIAGISVQGEAPWGVHSRWLSVVFLDPRLTRATPARIMERLERLDIESRPLWRPMHMQPLFAGAERVGGAVAETLFQRGLCLPSSSSLEPETQDRIIGVIRECLAANDLHALAG